MKKLLVVSSLLWAVIAQGTIILTEPFNYPDGAQISSQPGWTAHSQPGVGPQTVTNQHLHVVFGNQEDDSVALPGAPYNALGANAFTTNLYASMTLNFDAIPGDTNILSGGNFTGGYFAHFKDTSTGAAQTNGFRCRLFAYTNSAPAGQFYIALTSVGGTPTNSDYTIYTNLALSTNVNYSVVVRLGVINGDSQLWINPDNANSPSIIAPGPTNGAVDISTFAFRQVGGSPAAPGSVLVGSLAVGSVFTDVAGTNRPPNVSGISGLRIDTPQNVTTPPIPFTVSDPYTNNLASQITVSAVSSNQLVVANANITFASDSGGTNRTVTIKPSTGRQGYAQIRLVAKGPGGASNVVFFNVFVGSPSISSIQPQITRVGSGPTVVPFQVNDHEELAGSLTVAASSSNPSLVPNGNLQLASIDGTNRTLTITPASGQAGAAIITLTCTDGNTTVTNSFTYSVAPYYGVIFQDNFDAYPDGTQLGNSFSSSWSHYSGTLNELIVSNKMAIINETNSEDLYAPLANAPFSTNSGAIIYYGFNLNVAKLPSANGDYFMLLKDTTTSNFVAKTFVATGQAASGYYRVGVANKANAANAQYPLDLKLNTSYYVIVRHIVGTATTTVWVNPTSEGANGVSATDSTTPQEIDHIALREGTVGEGVEYIDNLVVGTAFTDVTPTLLVFPIANRSTAIGTSTGPIPFVVTDKAVSPDTCTYSGTSDNQTLVPNANISFGGSGTNRTVTVLPAAGQQGFANIAVNVSDSAGNANTVSFLVTVGNPATNGIVISQIYPGGGNSNATYTTKFVELFNRTGNPVSLNNWSLQYASSTGTSWTAANFPNVVVPAYRYYLVAIGTPGTNGVALPASADFTLSAINPSQTVGKLALCNSQGPLSGATPVGNATITDFVGYGAGTSAYEGTGPVVWTTDNTKAMFRASGGCVDANDNASDFSVAVVSPRNSATAANQCVSAAPTMRAFISGNNLVIAWPSTTVGFNLETATTVNQNPWTVVSTTPTVVGNEYQVSLPINSGAFYRMKH